MIVAYAGRRSGSLDVDLDRLGELLRDTLRDLGATALVGGAADGGDLLLLEAALALDPPATVHLVLPTPLEVFADDSVDDAWLARFEAVVEDAPRRGGSVRSLGLPPGAAAYREANQAFLDTALAMAGASDEVVALVVARVGEGEMVEDFLARAVDAGVRTVRVDPGAVAARP